MILKILFIVFLLNVVSSSKEKVTIDIVGDYTANLIKNVGIEIATIHIIEYHGYPVEEHYITTEDGYILKMHRIPYGKIEPTIDGRPAILLQHGLLCSSSDWVVTGANQALAFILADHGYDVWMGNARGNTHSRRHMNISSNKKEFWEFSWHEIGKYDLPAMIDYVISETNQTKIHYVGHSQGTTSFFVMGSIRPEYNDKILSMHALAPVAFMSNLVSPFIRALSPFVNQIEWIAKMLGVHEFLPSTDMMELGGYLLCRDKSPFQELCANMLFLIAGYNSEQLNRTQIPAILASTPAGASINQVIHYAQGINSGKFRQFDYGKLKNLKKYGTFNPPEYPLEMVKAPVYLHYSDNDWLAAVDDVLKLSKKLGNLKGKFRVSDPKFNHLDYQWGIDARTLLYKHVIKFMDHYHEKFSN